jgi:L-fuculose-phosphate aldolase
VSERELREGLVEVGRRCYRNGYISAYDGNFSVRLGEDQLLVTPAGACKGFLRPEEIVRTDLQGRPAPGQGRVSSEIKMHVVIYQSRPDVAAVVHGHPPTATGFAVAGLGLDRPALAEVIVSLGCIPLAGYGTPSTDELPEAIRPWIQQHDALLMANHGAVALGRDLFEAYFRMETIEHFARISLTAVLLGGPRDLPSHKVAELLRFREQLGLPPATPGCPRCEMLGSARSGRGPYPQERGSRLSEDDLVELVARALETLTGPRRAG